DREDYPTPPFTIDRQFYSQNVRYPEEIVQITTTGVIRGVAVARIEVFPIQYNPATRQLTAHSNIKFKI
ncbi:MAG: hypothetical protein GWN00_11760, partial [Aliifodinibius sp.]|nr:hypothetical protein [candidate division Zixibacteria bacterium]NIT56873.1 hypothetical protein [Fodinibius sp.]NIW47384.1 hypothetical protein [Gammaproteobacteria bacterium]NIS46189.1 hypothetical protein [candidate division Zixibacteria bacterium]NIU14291.1 hypothetical protein [candidate division Zixibacteria bacterium]